MSDTRVNLWGDSIKILSEKEKTDEILKKINNPKQTTKKKASSYLKSNKLSTLAVFITTKQIRYLFLT